MFKIKHIFFAMFFVLTAQIFISSKIYGEPISDLAKKMATGVKKGEKNKKLLFFPFLT